MRNTINKVGEIQITMRPDEFDTLLTVIKRGLQDRMITKDPILWADKTEALEREVRMEQQRLEALAKSK